MIHKYLCELSLLSCIPRQRINELLLLLLFLLSCIDYPAGGMPLAFMQEDCLVGHFFWKVVGSCAHTRESHTATVHGAPYTVNSRVVVGAIYAYMCTYSYRTWCTIHGELTCGGGGNIRIHMTVYT